MSRFEFRSRCGGADAGRTGGWLVVAVGVGVGGGAGGGVGGYSAAFWSDVLALDRFGGGVAFGFGFWPGCAIEFPSALKKSPTEPARTALGASQSAAVVSPTTIGIFTLLISIPVSCRRDARSTARVWAEPLQGEKLDLMPRAAIQGQVRGNFADDRGELEAVT